MRILCCAVLASLAWTGVGVASAQDYPHAFPREGAEQIFENERVIVWDATWPDGVAQPYHRHRYDMTGVFFRWGPLRVTRLDGTFTVSEVPFEIPWVFFQAKGVTHKEEGIGTPERHSIMIDMKDYAAPSRELPADIAPAFPREGAEEELDSPRVMVWDVSWSPGQDVPLHVHTRDTVAVFVNGGTIRQREPDGSEDTTTYASEDVVFIPAGTAHTSLVTSGSPRAMFYELKD
ncbi:MAG: hypothetical protein QGI10_13045 [Vicinamibacterales bacterium]|jgi:quercetin dioxygenase-like cupin family protein|nr:hypothetical protein [Vicinamibacterales bacterium]MDP7480186.1 hypothetical protein [Vicinamibacterales bacterium]MDP7691266.1 hypothetical protein [Vicinamibacterales bacterium]HJN42987.1 hypothetical protein [Vicinamibacterales bacterium]|tara:strand:- start:7956 stop:8654 length:699 start_codon:yes stop_codon:yes gene_type:complete